MLRAARAFSRSVIAAFAIVACTSLVAPAWSAPSSDATKTGASNGRRKTSGRGASAGADRDAKRTDEKKKKVDLDKLEVLSRFSTKFKCCEPRTKNIQRIAKMMDGIVVEPGQSFSVNHFVGARTEDKGFVAAPSILDLEYTETIGGGISQFATTLYNALYDAGFPILDHKPHSHYISRYPDGVEATLSWPAPDLVFKNDSEAPLVIKTNFARDRVTVKLYGRTPGRKVERKRPVLLERKAPPTEFVADRSVSPRKQKVERAGSPRKSVQVTRIVENPGGKRRVDEDVVVYLATKRVVRVHPCRLPKGHKEYTGESCSSKKKSSKSTTADGAKSKSKANPVDPP